MASVRNPQPRAVIYVRVSSACQEQDGISLETRKAACHRYGTQRGYAVARLILPTAASARRRLIGGPERWLVAMHAVPPAGIRPVRPQRPDLGGPPAAPGSYIDGNEDRWVDGWRSSMFDTMRTRHSRGRVDPSPDRRAWT